MSGLKALNFPPTDEQREIERIARRMIDMQFNPETKKPFSVNSMAVNAGAGVGKTATGLHIIENVVPKNHSCVFVSFNSKIKHEIENKLKKLKIHPKAKSKTFNGLAYNLFFQYYKIDYDKSDQIVAIDDFKARTIAEYLLTTKLAYKQLAQYKPEDLDKAYAQAKSYLVDLINFWQCNTTIDHDRKSDWVLKIFQGGRLADGDALDEFNPSDLDIVARLSTRYQLTVSECPLIHGWLNTLLAPALELNHLMMEKPHDAWDKIQAPLAKAGIKIKSPLKPSVKHWVTFTDMVYYSVVLNWKVRFRYMWVFADEAQDMSPLDRAIVEKHLYIRGGKRLGNICLTGDDKQAINGWRGADNNGFFNSQWFWGVRKEQVGKLSVSFRVTKNTAKLARTVKRVFFAHEDNKDGVIAHINTEDLIEMAKPGDAMLSRTGAELIKCWHMLTLKGKPARIKARDLITPIIKVIEDIEKLEGFRYSALPDFANQLYETQELKTKDILKTDASALARLMRLKDNIEIIVYLHETFSAINSSGLISQIETKLDPANQPKGEAIDVATAHSVKGAEFNTVFILTPEKFPLIFDTSTPEDIIQEYNLFYVAITRSRGDVYFLDKNKLALSFLNAKKNGTEANLYYDIPKPREFVPAETVEVIEDDSPALPEVDQETPEPEATPEAVADQPAPKVIQPSLFTEEVKPKNTGADLTLANTLKKANKPPNVTGDLNKDLRRDRKRKMYTKLIDKFNADDLTLIYELIGERMEKAKPEAS